MRRTKRIPIIALVLVFILIVSSMGTFAAEVSLYNEEPIIKHLSELTPYELELIEIGLTKINYNNFSLNVNVSNELQSVMSTNSNVGNPYDFNGYVPPKYMGTPNTVATTGYESIYYGANGMASFVIHSTDHSSPSIHDNPHYHAMMWQYNIRLGQYVWQQGQPI